MSDKIKLFDNVSLYATPELDNHLVTKIYADTNLNAVKNLVITTNPAISLTKPGQVFYLSLLSNATITLNSSGYTFGVNEVVDFTLIIFTTGVTATFPQWSWHNDVVPNLTNGGWYVIHCISHNGGSTWLAKLKGSYQYSTKCKWVTTLSDITSHTGTSLRDAVNMASAGDTVLFAPGLEGTIALKQGEIGITKSITINGNNKIIVDAEQNSRIFYVSSASADLTLDGLNITNGAVSGASGGGIYALGSLVMTNCTVSNCVLTESGTSSNAYFGGGVAVAKNFTATNCTFTGNSITGSGIFYGGGVSVSGISGTSSVFVLTNCTISNNTISSSSSEPCRGGGLWYSRSGGSATIEGCVISGNSSNHQGGGLHFGNGSDKPNIVIRKTSFLNNSASYTRIQNTKNGGALMLYQCNNIEISDCSFVGNMANSTIVYWYGYSGQPTGVIQRCLFSGNNTTYLTTAIVGGYNSANLKIVDSVFTGNTTKSAGNNVAVLYTSGSARITATNITLTNNGNFRAFRVASGSISAYNFVDVGSKAASSTSNATNYPFTTDYYLSNYTYGTNTNRIAYNSSLPLFESDGYTPSRGSQVIDVGNDTYVTSTVDFNGEDRIQGDSVDLGAVEYLLPVG